MYRNDYERQIQVYHKTTKIIFILFIQANTNHKIQQVIG